MIVCLVKYFFQPFREDICENMAVLSASNEITITNKEHESGVHKWTI